MEATHTIKHKATVRLPWPGKVTIIHAVDAVQALANKAPADAEVFYDQQKGVLTAEWEGKQ